MTGYGWGRRSVLAAGAALALTAGTVSAAAAAPPGRTAVADYVPLWSLPTAQDGAAAEDLGVAASSRPVAARVYLAGRDPAGLAARAKAVSTPGNPLYRKYLTPAQEQAQYGPTAARTEAVRSWLRAAGLRVTEVTAHSVEVTGTAAQAARAFGGRWHSYRVGANPVHQYGEQVADTPQQAPVPGAQLSVPAPIASAVATVAPMETRIPGYLAHGAAPASGKAPAATGQSTAAVPQNTTAAPPAAASPRPGSASVSFAASASASASAPAPAPAPCSAYFGQRTAATLPTAYGAKAPYAGCGYTPQQLRGAYGVPSGLSGAGVSEAVVAGGHTPSMAGDLATFGARHGEPLAPGQFSEIVPPGLDASCATQGPMYSEDFADVQEVHAMAPAAHLTDLGVKCDDDGQALPMLDAYAQIADARFATVVSSAYNARYNEATLSPGLIAVYEQVFEQGATEGIGYYVDSDDEGDDSAVSPTHAPTISYPDADPWVTGVGGTTLAIGPHSTYQWEAPWGDHTADLTTTGSGQSWGPLPGDFLGGGGGGTSRVFTQPGYQRGVVPGALSHSGGRTGPKRTAPMRVLPDIAADAGLGSGVRVGVTVALTAGQPAAYHEFSLAGTSVSVQLIAGMQADAEQAAGSPLGFANPAIYARYGTGAYHDVTSTPTGPGAHLTAVGPAGTPQPGSPTTPYLITMGLDQTLTATPGYDDTTGVGTPDPRYFASYGHGRG